jgi:hypothetical protein
MTMRMRTLNGKLTITKITNNILLPSHFSSIPVSQANSPIYAVGPYTLEKEKNGMDF